MTLFVVVGKTRGDGLIKPKRRNLGAFETRGEAQEQLEHVTAFRDRCLQQSAAIPMWAEYCLYGRYVIEEVAIG